MSAGEVETRAASYSGTWSWGTPDLGGCRLLVRDDAAGTFFRLECRAGPPSRASGVLSGRLELSEGKARFRLNSAEHTCELFFRFGDSKALVEQHGDLTPFGFGHGLSANGVYKRTDRDVPREVSEAAQTGRSVE
jgi:hypothetical protein